MFACILVEPTDMRSIVIRTLIYAGLVSVTLTNDSVIFGDDQGAQVTPPGGCQTIGGPAQGLSCVFPFIFKGLQREGCITESDPEGKTWCSTGVDSDGNHIANGKLWAHCSDECPLDTSALPQASSSSQGALSSAFTVSSNLTHYLTK